MRRPTRFPVVFLLLIIWLHSATVALAVDRTWNNSAGGIYNSTVNWAGNIVPTAADNGIFNQNSTYTVTMNAGTTSGGMNIRNDTVTLNPGLNTLTLSGAGLTVGDLGVVVGRFTLTNGTIASSDLDCGINGAAGNATITTGGIITSTGGVNIGQGQCNIFNGGRLTTSTLSSTLGTGTAGIAFFQIQGGTSSWVNNTGSVQVGVTNPASISMSFGTMSTPGMLLGVGAPGTFTASGLGMSAQFTNNVSVGRDSPGTFVLSSNGVGTCTTNFFVGDHAGSTGMANLSSSASLNITAGAFIGNSGAGTFNVSNTSTGTCSTCSIGTTLGGSGTMSVDNSTWTSSGNVSVGSAGAGVVTLSSGATFNAAFTVVGTNVTGSGSINISLGSQWISGSTTIGQLGSGAVNITNFGTFTVTGLTMGNGPDSDGQLNVTGISAQVNNTGGLAVGSSGVATLNLSSAAHMTSGGANIGLNTDGTGDVTVQNVGTTWTNTGSLSVANGGNGTLRILSGGVVTNTQNVQVGLGIGSAGTLILSGNQSRLDCGGSLFVGGSSTNFGGSGFVQVLPGAQLNIGSLLLLRIRSTGVVNLDGGTISTGSLGIDLGGAFNFNSGTLNITSPSGITIAQGTSLGSSLDITPGKALMINTSLTIGAGAIVRTSGGTFTVGTLFNVGELLLADRTSTVIFGSVDNRGLLHGDGRIVGTVGNDVTGEIRANAGDDISFINGQGLSSNSGRINLLGGTVEYDQLVNNAAGRITGHGFFMTTSGLTNNGTVTFSSDTTDVMGNVTNNAGSKVIVTGGSTSTFFDNVTNTIGSEFRVSTNSTAVFLGSVTGLASFTGPGTKDFEGAAMLGPLVTQGVSIVGPAATLTATTIREGELRVEGVAFVQKDGTSTATSRVNALTIDGATDNWTGTLDLNDNDLIVDYTGTNPLPTIRNQLRTGYNHGLWGGHGITSSTAGGTTALGYADNAVLNLSNFSGQTVDSTSILVKYTYYGDSNLDGQVDVTDLGALATNWQSAADWTGGDFNYDGFVDVTDLGALATNWQAGVGSPLARTRLDEALAAVGLGGVNVPEPLCLGCVAFIATVAARPRRLSRSR